MNTIFDIHSKDRIETAIKKAIMMLEAGAYKTAIFEQLDMEMIEEIYDIAVARRNAKLKGLPDNLYFNQHDLRFATPKVVADYRAKRLQCDTIADLGCSVGMQTFAFARKCKKVYAVEIDERKMRYCIENAKILDIHNVEFILGDALDEKIIEKIKDSDVVFCDPERLPQETERTVKTIAPNPEFLLKKYGKNLSIEFPPQISKTKFDCEWEYLSVEGQLNRLTLYFGDLKKTDISAVALPSSARIENDKTTETVINKKNLPMKYLYEVDSAVVKAGLNWQLAKLTKTVPIEISVLTSDELVESPFFKNSFIVLETVHHDFDSIVKSLQKNDVGKIIIRYKILPQDYWTERTRYEKYLTGKKTAQLFIFEKAVIAEKL